MAETPLLSISCLLEEYRAGRQTPAGVLADIRSRAAQHAADNIWIHLLTEAETALLLDRALPSD